MTKVQAMDIKGNVCKKCGCGFTDMKTAHFHHMRSYSKLYNMSDMFGRYSEEATRAELEKCMLLCENCHRKLHKALGKKIFKKDSLRWVAEK